MNETKQRHPMTMQEVIYEIPGMKDVPVERDIEFRGASGTPLSFDLYRPANIEGRAPAPAVLFVEGFSDPAFESFVGCKFKEMAGYVGWARLMAATGIAAITYTNQDPVADLDALVSHLRQTAAGLELDAGRLGVWACSGNVPTALGMLMRNPVPSFAAAVLCYGPMLELPGSTAIADTAKHLGFAYPCRTNSIDDMPADLPLLVVRAGKETMPGLNASIDHFAAAALARNFALTLVNHATGPHAFDLNDPSELSREMVRRMLAFMRFHMRWVRA